MKKRKRSKAKGTPSSLTRARSKRKIRGLSMKQIEKLMPENKAPREYSEQETAERQALYLAALARTGLVSKSAKAAGVSRGLVYRVWRCEGTLREWTDEDLKAAEIFKDMEFEALEQATDLLEAEARRRGLKGIDKPIIYKGKIVGHMKEYSDRLLERLLEANRAKFARAANVKVEGVTPPAPTITRIERVIVKPQPEGEKQS